MGADETATAAARLRLLRDNARAPITPSTGPRSRTRGSESRPPIDVAIIDHIAATYREVIAHTREIAPDAGPAPADEAAAYEWMAANTPHLTAEQQQTRDAMLLGHSLKHALALGDETVIRRIPCPQCACWSLFWRHTTRVAACVNRHCRDKRGRPSTWVLQQLAEHRVAAKIARSRTAT
ncbi:hypothetical protein [Streptomyces sp. DSM 41534]